MVTNPGEAVPLGYFGTDRSVGVEVVALGLAIGCQLSATSYQLLEAQRPLTLFVSLSLLKEREKGRSGKLSPCNDPPIAL